MFDIGSMSIMSAGLVGLKMVPLPVALAMGRMSKLFKFDLQGRAPMPPGAPFRHVCLGSLLRLQILCRRRLLILPDRYRLLARDCAPSGLQISTSVPDLGTSIQMPAITTGIIVNSPIILS